ncbi:MAG: Fis family transcriptional regulator [Propylenella sp.]
MPKATRHWGSSFDDWLKEEGIYEEVTAGAIKAIIADQLEAKMKKEAISKTRMAAMLKIRRTELDRLLDPKNDSATLELLLRAATVVGRELRLELV